MAKLKRYKCKAKKADKPCSLCTLEFRAENMAKAKEKLEALKFELHSDIYEVK